MPRLQRTLDTLCRQTYPQDRWEVVIVDNASPAPLAEELARRAHPRGRVIYEPRLGLTHARLAGIAAAQGSILIFADDDNLLREGYLAEAARFLAEHPSVAVAGGLIRGEFESPPACWAEDHLWSLAVRNYGDRPLISEFTATGAGRSWPVFCPVGAGMVVRAEAARRYTAHCATTTTVLADRQGKSLGSAGDCELVMHAAFLAGAQVAYTPELELTHLIPNQRLKFGYLARLNYEGGVCWGKFLVRYGFQSHISRLSLLARIPRAFLHRAGWTRKGFIAWASAAGEFTGRTAA
jgi:glycosyltransferase involved in cell wall biosynthesis